MRIHILAAAGLMLAASPAAAQKYNLTVAGYSPGGLVSTIGIGMDKALSKQFPGSAVTYQTGSGGLANAMLVSRGKAPLGRRPLGRLAAEGRDDVGRVDHASVTAGASSAPSTPSGSATLGQKSRPAFL